MPTDTPLFLFSIDLEDVRSRFEGGERHAPRVAEMTQRYLEFLREHDARCTFFVVGENALENRSLIAEIAAEGHEIACHTHTHRPLTEQTPQSLREDLRRNIAALQDCGAGAITGFRAPVFSLVESTEWAYEVLAELGFTYSSSVLPAKNTLHGWKDFGAAPRALGGVVELPMTLLRTPAGSVPLAGGMYFRVLPWQLLKLGLRRHAAAGEIVLSYLHPYDVDTEQERFMHPGIRDSRAFNWLMYHGRGRVFDRLDRVLAMGFRIDTYERVVRERLGGLVST